MNEVLDTESVKTDAGEYLIQYIHDPDAEQPYDESMGLWTDGRAGDGYIGNTKIDISEGDLPSLAWAAIRAPLDSHDWYDQRSGAAIVRYLKLLGLRSVTEVDSDYHPIESDANRDVRVRGVAWVASADITDPDLAVRTWLAVWRAWAESDCFGYQVVAPDGKLIEDCWGYYGYWAELDLPYVKSEAYETIAHDQAKRHEEANLVGSGFVGLI